MKLHILSDLHTEFAEFVPPETGAEAVILAGDIGVGVEGIRLGGASLSRSACHLCTGQSRANTRGAA